jgi:hypothetical protein
MDPAHDYPGYQPRRKRRPPWLGIALAIAVVIIVVLSAVVITQLTNNKSDTPTQAAPSSTTLPASPRPSTTQPRRSGTASPTMTCQGYTAAVDPTSQPGWQPTVDKRGLAYAVPPDWTVAKCGVRIGWAQPCPQGQCVIREIGAVSTIANPTCEKQNLAIAGVAASKNPDIKAALDEESKTVPIIYTQGGKAPTVEYGPVREFSIGTHPAVQMVATVTDIATDQCTGASAFHSIVVTTVPNIEGSVVFLISLREGTNASPNPDVINKIVKTLRSPA